MVEKLTENTVEEFIKSTPVVIIKAYMDGCPACESFAETYEEYSKLTSLNEDIKFGEINIPASGQSAFRSKYMKAAPGEPAGAPCVFKFENGKYLDRVHGTMSEAQLDAFVVKGIKPERKPKAIQDLSLVELKAAVYDNMGQIEFLNNQNQQLNQEIARRQQLQK